MADPNDSFSTLDDFLLSLADGITRAQDELTRAALQDPSGRQYAYHLPRVEFELKMNLRVVEDTGLSDRYRTLRLNRPTDKHLLFKPATADSASSTLDIAAVVRGAFVSVPANGGLPGTSVSTSVDTKEVQAPVVRVIVANTAGEPVPSTEVQFNVDREESSALTSAAGGQFTLAPDTAFDQGVVVTDKQGVARSTLRIGSRQLPALLALTVDVMGRTETLVYEVKA
jgi:hypothetical protein